MRLETFLTTTRNLFSSFPFNSCLNVTIKWGWSNEQFIKCSQNPGKLKIRTTINKRWNKINTVDFIKRYLCGILTDYPNFFFLSFLKNHSAHKIGLHSSSVDVKLFFFLLPPFDVIKFITKEIHNSLYDIRILVPPWG